MSHVEIDSVVLAGEGDGVLAHGLDTPRTGLVTGFYGFDVRGWAVGRGAPAESVVVRRDTVDLREASVSGDRADVAEAFPEVAWSRTSGFLAPVGALSLNRRFQLGVHLRLADGAEDRLAVIAGRRSELRSDYRPQLQPVCLTALGRTGSTAVARLLSGHPQVAAYRPFEFEPRVVSYWIDVLKALSDPIAFRRQITPNGPLRDDWWRGAREPYPRRLPDAVQASLGGQGVDALAGFCQSRIDGFYTHVTAPDDGGAARYFVEKTPPETGSLVRELYPHAREIFLVRDFRDMVASIFAFNVKRGFQGFGRDRAASDEEYVSEWLAVSVASFLQAWRDRSAGAHLMRYESLVREPRETLVAALDYLGLEAAPATIDGMIEALDAPESDVHRTTGAESSIGRWKHDLPLALQETCERAFHAALAEFGYDN
jgi:Sulfotransferase family